MKRPSIYVKMKVLGAIDVVEGKTRHERIHNVAEMTFLDEEGDPHRFTWRTIQTWYYRYKNYGITGMTNNSRADKGRTRKVTPEEVLEAINSALPHFHQKKKPNKSGIYRFCIEKGLLRTDQIALTTFCRFVREYELLKEDAGESKRWLAFSKQYTAVRDAAAIDDAHLMDMANLHKLRLPFEDFPKDRNLILIGQPVLLTNLSLAVNQDLKSRVTYSVITKRLTSQQHARLHPSGTRLRRISPRHLHRGRHGADHSLGRRGLAQMPQPLSGHHARSGPRCCRHHDRHRSGQPCPPPASLAKGNRHHRFLINRPSQSKGPKP